jgi:hypothetical protein
MKERSIFSLSRGEAFEMGQRGVAGAEVIERDAEAHGVQIENGFCDDICGPVEDDVFRDLELDLLGGDAEIPDDAAQRCREIGIVQLRSDGV